MEKGKEGQWRHGHFVLEEFLAETASALDGGSAVVEESTDYYECSKCGYLTKKKTRICHSCHSKMEM